MCINVWRAISAPPQDFPLAVCDARSLATTRPLTTYLITTDRIPDDMSKRAELLDGPVASEASLFPYNEDQRWWYFSDMTADEMLALVLYDSDKGDSGRVPHTAFANDREDAISRESVEMRCVLYFH